MTKSDFEEKILAKIPHEPTTMQREAAQKVADFLKCKDRDAVFLLTGYAGTGKTTLMAALVKTVAAKGMETVLLAPTGRAAKVIANYSERCAYTIHKEIYREKTFQGPETMFDIDINRHRGALFIVDEASMITGEAQSGNKFGTGDLLEDLIQYVYSSPGCRLMLVGDTAQLPPVGYEESPALDAQWLAGYDMNVMTASLTEVVRQDAGGILYNATMLRNALRSNRLSLPQLQLKGFADIVRITGSQLIEALEDSYSKCGIDDTIVLTRSNKRAGIYNRGIRSRILEYEELLTGGDRIIVVKNNYFWIEPENTAEPMDSATVEALIRLDKATVPPSEASAPSIDTTSSQPHPKMSFIANGESAIVQRYRNVRNLHGFHFADVCLSFSDYECQKIEATIITDTLMTETPALTREQQQELFNSVWEGYSEYKNKRDRIQAVRHDPLFNALQIKYGYAITCHKAQGGQWRHVYIDIGYMTNDMLNREYIKWLYTALTRATEKVYLINWPISQLTPDSQPSPFD